MEIRDATQVSQYWPECDTAVSSVEAHHEDRRTGRTLVRPSMCLDRAPVGAPLVDPQGCQQYDDEKPEQAQLADPGERNQLDHFVLLEMGWTTLNRPRLLAAGSKGYTTPRRRRCSRRRWRKGYWSRLWRRASDLGFQPLRISVMRKSASRMKVMGRKGTSRAMTALYAAGPLPQSTHSGQRSGFHKHGFSIS